GNAILNRAEPVSAATDGLILIFGTHVAKSEAAKRIDAAEEPAIEKRHAIGVSVAVDRTKATSHFQDVAFKEPFEEPMARQFELIEISFAAERAACDFGAELGALAAIRQLHAIASIVCQGKADLGDEAV